MQKRFSCTAEAPFSHTIDLASHGSSAVEHRRLGKTRRKTMESRRSRPTMTQPTIPPGRVAAIVRLGIWGLILLTGWENRAADSALRAATILSESTELWQHDAALHDVIFRGPHGWAVGEHGTIRHTSDGKTWEFQRSGTQASLRSVYFLDERTGWAAGGEVLPGSQGSVGVVLKTDDGGRTWTPIARGNLPLVLKIGFFDAGHGWAVTAPGPTAPVGLFLTA
ncbi:MAG: hypothetical protein D6741_17580, partial [Planctomycetota bacterium]